MKYKNLAIIAILMVVVQAGCGGAIYVALGNWSDRGAFGDMFGAVAALFSGLAIAFVIYTLRYKSKNLDCNVQK